MRYAPHELLEVMEMATTKTVTITKSTAMQILVSDPELKEIMQEDVVASARHLKQLQAILSKAAEQEELV